MTSKPRLDDAFRQWRGALTEAMTTPAGVMAWQDRRFKFAYEVGEQLAGQSAPGVAPVTGHVVYGVFVPGARLVYVGKTDNASRRLRDLPVGESHHLATTVPPEIWDRVIVIQWPALLAGAPSAEARAAEQLGLSTCGLSLEHLLQIAYRPVLAERRRGTGGRWTARRIDTSRSKGAISSSQFPGLFQAVREEWDALAQAEAGHGRAVAHSAAGRAVFPWAL
jgi:hypothetical protein